MKANFDLDKAEKRMPYTVPGGFFADMEENILNEINKSRDAGIKQKRTYMRVFMGAVSAIAATVALLFVSNVDFPESRTDGFSDIEQAFCRLSHEDQAYLLEVYRDDIFINE